MKRDKKGIEELVKWINRIVSKEKEKDKYKKNKDNHSKSLTKLPLIPQKTSMIKFLVLFFLHGKLTDRTCRRPLINCFK